MYLWKYWRESRNTFAGGLLLVGLLLWAALKIPVGVMVNGNQNADPGQFNPAQIYVFVGAILTLPLAFMALLFGGFGAGRDLGEGSGSFLFSRPRSRAFFAWSDWSAGMAQLLLLVLAANSVLLLAVRRAAPANSGPIILGSAPASMFSVFCVHCAAGLLLAGLIFGLAYFTSVLARSRGVLLSIGILVAYLAAKSIVKHYWPDITLPDLSLTEFNIAPTGGASFVDHLGLDIAARAAVALLFPVAAQMLLERRDVE